jgi:putative lipoprotein
MKYSHWIAALLILLVVACSPGGKEGPGSGIDTGAASEPVTPDVTLTNTYWKLVELNGRAVQPGEGRELHMILRGEDQVAGYAGCNQFTGSVTVTGDGLAFGPMASTRRMCADVMAQEDAFLQALESAHRFEIAGEDLAIENGAGEIVMRFAAVYMP